MAARVLVLIMASTLFGTVPACRCRGLSKEAPQKTSCGHCPTESTPKPSGCPISDCCCIHEGTDRTSEEAYVLPANGSLGDLDWIPPKAGVPSSALESVPTLMVGGVHRRSGPLLHILFRQLTI